MHGGNYSCFVGLDTFFTEELYGLIYLGREHLSINMGYISLCEPVKLCEYVLFMHWQHFLFSRIRSTGSSCSL